MLNALNCDFNIIPVLITKFDSIVSSRIFFGAEFYQRFVRRVNYFSLLVARGQPCEKLEIRKRTGPSFQTAWSWKFSPLISKSFCRTIGNFWNSSESAEGIKNKIGKRVLRKKYANNTGRVCCSCSGFKPDLDLKTSKS